MMQATIVPSFIDPPRPGKKNFSVKDKDNVRWSVPPGIAQNMQKGQAVIVDYEVNEFQGKSYNIVKGIAGSMSPPSQPQTAARPAPKMNGSKSVGEEASMFAMGLLNRLYAGTGVFPGFEVLRDQIVQARGAWLNAMGQTRGPEVKPPEPPPFDDDIPL
jgi:hypothetical protein